ncbi:MAG: hypothetical protein ACP5MD_11580, partial [Verrucomicrobiia bacterium]
AYYPMLVTSVTDPYGRTARFYYDANGYLTSVVDVGGIQSSFQYSGQEPPRRLWRLTTPYGSTDFQVTENEDPADEQAYTRGVVVALPEGQKAAAMYYKGGAGTGNPNFPDSFDEQQIPQDLPVENAADVYDRNVGNSHYWDTAQAAQLSTTNLALLTGRDFLLARTRHWLLAQEQSPRWIGTSFSWEQSPSPDGTNAGAITWYGHDNKPAPHQEGSSIQPSVIARVMPGGSTWYQWHQRNCFGHTTNLIERWIDIDDTQRFRTNRFIYSSEGLDLLAHIGPDGQVVSGYTYDSNHPHLPVAITNAIGEVTRYYYDSAANGHRLLGIAHASGLASTNYYSGNWLACTVDLLGSSPFRTNSYTWQDGRVRTQTDARGLTRTFTTDNLGRLTRIDFPDNTCIQYAYTNGAGAMLLDRTAARDRLGNWTYYEYNGLRQLTRLIDPLGRETRYSYCSCGGPDSVTRAYGTSVAETTQYQYDYAGRLILTIQPDGTTVTNTYDPLGRLANVGRPHGTTTNYYDNLDRLYAVENAAGLLLWAAYDSYDRIILHTDSNGLTVTNSYDGLGRLVRRTTLADNGTESWGYSFGLSSPASYTNQVGNVTLWAYDAAGRKTNEIQVGVFTNSFAWTPGDDLASLSDGKGNTTSWKYDSEGRVTEKWYQGQTTADLLYWYNANGWLTCRFTRTGTGSNTNGYTTSYSYDAVGNLTQINYPAGTASVTNQYDALNRLTNRLDGLGQTKYTYAVLGNGM